jgi:HAE1 family hydrophobic/amphiphilic exporter-1/multidrug efflux pump
MRIWLDPVKLNKYALTMDDVTPRSGAERAGLGRPAGRTPAPKEQMLNATVSVQSRLTTPEQFAQIRLKSNTDARWCAWATSPAWRSAPKTTASIPSGTASPAPASASSWPRRANALTRSTRSRRVNELAKTFPPDIKVIYPYDTTPFVRLSIEQVVHTLVEAVVLVFLVMFLFLQNFRATLIPTIAVPVVLLGTFAVMAVAGYSINTLTLFGMVLAIGLLVDDAIVVVENVERLITTEHLSPIDAARKSMDEITGALIGIALVLSAVFLPMAFFGGSTGVIYRQFSITIVSAMVLSVLVALVLTPRCAPPSSSRTIRTSWKAMARWRASSAGSTTSSIAARRSMKRACAAPRAAGSARAWSIC